MDVSFSVSLLSALLDRSIHIIDTIERRLLNVQGKDTSRTRNRAYFEQAFDGCFFETVGMASELSQFKGRLAAAHAATGFEAVLRDTPAHTLDPLELIDRACRHWQGHRWPGRNGRLAYAQMLYSVYMLRQLEHLSLRIWNDGAERAGDRLQDVQGLLDRLNAITSPNVFVRDARWLIQTAQGPLTRNLGPYFRIAEQISGSFTDTERLEIHRAGAKLAGGHLRSQLRYRARETGRSIDDPEVLSITRNSNSMDVALLVRDLVPLLDAYATADTDARLDLADAILQGLSADPELLLTRLDLLGPCTMIEQLFIDRSDGGSSSFTPTGESHLACLARYARLIADLAEPLIRDAGQLDPSRQVYSPLGIAYGFCADILSNMALDTLLSQPGCGLSLEDIFVSLGSLEQKQARAQGWMKLPAREGDGEHFEHSLEWAGAMFQRTIDALRARATHKAAANASTRPNGRLFVVPESHARDALPEGSLPNGIVSAQEHCVTSEVKRALATGATAFPRSQIVMDRNEGRFLASSETDAKWFGVSKVVLTTCTSQGKDALITDVPPAIIHVLRLTCPELLIVASATS